MRTVTIGGRKNRFAKIFGIRIDLDHLQEVCRDLGHECVILSDDNRLFAYYVQAKDHMNQTPCCQL